MAIPTSVKPRTGMKRTHVVVVSIALVVTLIHFTTSDERRLPTEPTASKLPPEPNVRLNPDVVRQKLLAMGQTPILKENEADPWKAELFARLDHVRVSCGTLCQLNTLAAVKQRTVPVSGSPIPMVVVPDVNCPAIMGDEGIDAGDRTVPAIPDELRGFFTLGGSYGVTTHERMRNIYVGGAASTQHWKTGNVWEEADIDEAIDLIRQGRFASSYGVEATHYVRDKLAQVDIKGKRILVVGSEAPWVEAIVLYHGAAEVVTLEYGVLISHHPKLKTMVPQQFREQYFSGELGEFDGVVTHSSLEHSGLGRYGDALNPWGDILGVARAWCVTKDGGFLYLGLPTGKDVIYSNWHRIYGHIRWPLVATNWRSLDRSAGSELNSPEESSVLGGHGFLFEKVSKAELASIAKIH